MSIVIESTLKEKEVRSQGNVDLLGGLRSRTFDGAVLPLYHLDDTIMAVGKSSGFDLVTAISPCLKYLQWVVAQGADGKQKSD